jgi:GT2 family glycosyltransferase
MNLSIVIPVLNSHEIVRRQLLYFRRIGLPPDVELILVDDGSEPALQQTFPQCQPARIVCTHDPRPWTQPKARNLGASVAVGRQLLFTDIDHILPLPTIEFARHCPYDYAKFRRQLGILDEDGYVTQDYDELLRYGVPTARLDRWGVRLSCHVLSMVIRREVFDAVGGFRERMGQYPTHDDGHMKRQLKSGGYTKCPDHERPTIYMIPSGRLCGKRNANPFGLFHSLVRE